MYQSINDNDEFEPRVTPKPASKLDCFITPSVPEVSLIFEKPSRSKTWEHKGVAPSSPHTNGSYASWKEQNYVWKPAVSNPVNCAPPRSKQHNQSDTVQQPFLPDGTNANTLREQRQYNEHHYSSPKDLNCATKYREHRKNNESYNNPYKAIPQPHESNRLAIKQKLNIRSPCNNVASKIDSVPTTPHSISMHPNGENTTSYSRNKGEYPQFPNNRILTSHSSEQQQILLNGPINEPVAHNGNTNQNMFSKTELQPPPHIGYQYPYIDVNTYPFPQIYTTAYPTHTTDNQETVKNLLQLVNSQSEQIKSLQLQVDRLLKMQEQTLSDKQRCACVSHLSQQNEQLSTNSCNIIDTSNCVTQPQNQNARKDVMHNVSTKERMKDELNEHRNDNHPESLLPEAQAKKTFMEQKVSIGVMTSFEFTVQNSPFALDPEDYEKQECQRKHENMKGPTGLNVCEASEALRRYKNSFTRIPSVQLENIVEDSESYLSSSHQQSSNMNASISAKDIEKPTHADSQREQEACRSDYPRSSAIPNRTLNQSKAEALRYSENMCNEELNHCDIRKSPVTQNNNDAYNAQRTDIYAKNGALNAAQCTKLNMQKRNSPIHVNSKNSPLGYSNCQQNGENTAVCNKINRVEDSLILSGGDLNVVERPPPTPDPSIHVDMHEYSSDDDSEKVKRTSKVGWTFYNNVLGQVNKILQNSCVMDDQEQIQAKTNHNNELDDAENRAVMDTVKFATLEQLRKLGISLSENPEPKEGNGTNKVAFDSSYYPRLDCQANVTQATSAANETNTSMHMKALALKYLSDEQLSELAFQRQGSTALKHLMLSNVQGTNMSFATMRYLERYQLLPGKNNLQVEGNTKMHAEMPSKPDMKFATPKGSPAVQRLAFSQTPRTTCPSKILDISTLKQQPKLL